MSSFYTKNAFEFQLILFRYDEEVFVIDFEKLIESIKADPYKSIAVIRKDIIIGIHVWMDFSLR